LTIPSGNISLQEKTFFRVCLAVISGLLLGFSFPPSPFYSLAYVAFIPLFYLFSCLKSYKQIAVYLYLFLLVFHIVTVYWTGGFVVGKDIWMMIAGGAVLFIHPMFFLPFIVLFFFVKKRLGFVPGLIAFALFWTSFEYLHSLGEYSFPWLTIGNSQAYDLNRIQIIEYSSIYGLTLLIFAFNILSFILLRKITDSSWTLRSFSVSVTLIILVIIYFGPAVYGKWIIEKEKIETKRSVRVGIIQPNIDPWDKWGGGSREKWNSYLFQINTLIDETKIAARSKPDIVFWPETAIPFHILVPKYSTYLSEIQLLIDSLNLPVFTGLPTIEYFDSLSAPATAQNIYGTNTYVESYNSTALFQPGCPPGPVHRKSILVPFAERIPYAETFRFLIEPLKWNVGISSWGKGGDTLIYTVPLNNKDSIKFSGMICYESAYPNYVKEFVKRGAEFLIVVTNDSWWGKTSGAYQHASFASLRAVETRRWVIQCANGGISLIVDPTGTPYMTTDLYSKTQFVGNIFLRSNMTFYVNHGDIAALICITISVLIFFAAVLQKKKTKRTSNGMD
jgi:apolipoprotein N-acyltransferase